MQVTSFFPLVFAALAAAADPLGTVLKANNGTLSTFSSLLAMAPGLSQTLGKAVDITILAPSNTAFAKAMEMDPTFSQKATNATFVADLLMYHVVTGKTPAASFPETPKFAETFFEIPSTNVTGNQKVELSRKGEEARVFSGYKQLSVVTNPDIAFMGGVLHIVDSVLTFPGTPAETAMNTGLTSMAGALMHAGLVDSVDSLQAATVFAPTNAAFQAIGATAASMEPQDLAKILQYHVLTNQVRFSSAVTMTKMAHKSLNGEKVTLRKQDGSVYANSAKVTIADMITTDGVMHVIDSVLNPASPKLTPGTSTPAFAGAVQAANAPFTENVNPTANYVPASSGAGSFSVSLNHAMLVTLGCLAAVYL
ncbi:fasciclin-like arabinogalactan protein [Colletotrichum spaethianum]|uniref:Fasciclin-like arabinogalactan protein n=1 Tax=Colletotrichum spaethianum TaxID=700344 RepID=A0AA37L9S5_9PEZI|nr:fasciclin-like arabinogalactan protein [Colletotrichum spaethianum]GKT42660.1 fasciclin-like arabinogalactan protein [Colletotrichum spaethianum]